MFSIDNKIESDSYFVTNLKLSQVRLHKNAIFPWIILIPRGASYTEIIDLDLDSQMQLMKEIRYLSTSIYQIFSPDKLNIANIGNIVSQLHIHMIARYISDPLWPGVVWNHPPFLAYTNDNRENTISLLLNSIAQFSDI